MRHSAQMAVCITTLSILYDNKYSSVINIYFYETFSTQSSSACTLKHFLDALSDIFR
jgi:hypothetical protein